MKSERPKVLHQIAGRSLIDRVLETAGSLNPATTTIVVGHGSEDVKQALGPRPGRHFVVQEPQLGTGHALLQTAPVLRGLAGTVVLLSGDVPLLTRGTLEGLVRDPHRRRRRCDGPDGRRRSALRLRAHRPHPGS